MRTIKKIHNAAFSPIADLITYSPLPSPTLEQIDPFIFLNHHGYQEYPPNNTGLPFGQHPHRGMETVTFIVEGDIMHKDSAGHESVIQAGGIQWMTAGKGLIHAEVSSENFKRQGGKLEILQLWINLPSRLKMTEPNYIGLQKSDIPSVLLDNGNVNVNVISGSIAGKKGAIESLTKVSMSTILFKPSGSLSLTIAPDDNIFFYVIRGAVTVNNTPVKFRQLVEFNHDNEKILMSSDENSLVIFGHALPINEPVFAQGPFVMNTEAEIRQAYEDYREGKFGIWQ